MLAEWNWIPGNEGERSRRASFSFYVWGQDFSWPALIPWLSVLWCCWWIMTQVEGETGFFLSHWAKGPLSLGSYELNSSFSRKHKKLFSLCYETLCVIRQMGFHSWGVPVTNRSEQLLTGKNAPALWLLLFLLLLHYQDALVNLSER